MRRKNKIRALITGLGNQRGCLLLGVSATQRMARPGRSYNDGDPFLYFFPPDEQETERIYNEVVAGGHHSPINVTVHELRGQRFNVVLDRAGASMALGYSRAGRVAPAHYVATLICKPERLTMTPVGNTDAGRRLRIIGHHSGPIELVDDEVASALIRLGAKLVTRRTVTSEVVSVKPE